MQNNTSSSFSIPFAFITFCLISMATSSVGEQQTSLDIGVGIEPDPQFFPDFPDFSDYVIQFDKNYELGTVEYQKRKEIY